MHSQSFRLWTARVAESHTCAGVSATAMQVAASAAGRRGMRAALLMCALATIVPCAAQAQQGPFAYVPNLGSNNVSVIDTSTNSVASPAIPVGLSPVAVA